MTDRRIVKGLRDFAIFMRLYEPKPAAKPEPAHVKPMVKAAMLNIIATSNTRGRL